ncbi:Proteasome adapter and scaffold protein M29 [Clonorchis sinensis]|uniref:Proteasome adapter and scaffold protein M29 n=1 Tax=Clonorchis sinensis TaxID=79923 RepID=A0A8T1M204_CLOSI|nr:Proteasome adapter and scaffold protein M29 [Clonorchis sinensis]
MTTMVAPVEDLSRPSEDIDRLALRISLADDDEQFEKVVQKSLVCILKYLAIYEEHRKKLMELLGDVTRRLKCRPNIQIPVHELFVTYNDSSNLVFLINFSHMYIRLGYPRLPFLQQVKLLPVLFASLTDGKPVCQRDALLHITLPFIGNVTSELVPRDLDLSELPTQRRFITDFYSLILLTPYNVQRLVRFDGTEAVIPDGFNAYDLSRVVHDRFSTITSAEELEKYKVGVIQFYSRHFFPAEESIIPILFGYGDTRHSVVSAAAKELRTLSMLVDWEDEILLSRILTWYLGRRREFDPKGRNEPRRPLSATMRIKLGHYLLRSRITLPGLLAPGLVEAALLALEAGAHSQPPPPPPLAVANNNGSYAHPPTQGLPNGSEVVHTCEGSCGHHLPAARPDEVTDNGSAPNLQPTHRSATLTTSIAQRKRLAEHGLDLLAHLINNVSTLSGPASVAALRCLINFVYERSSDELTVTKARGFELLSQFLSRDPHYLLKDPAQLPRLFDVLSEENPSELKMAAANCLRRLAVTFQDAQRQNHPALRAQLGKLERLLYENIEKPDPLCRSVAVNFAGLIYPSDHIPTRYLILQALGDKDPNVRREACMAFEQFLDPNIIHDIVYGRVKLPSFVEFVNHDTQHSRKNPFVEVERLIPVVQFIRLCLLATRGGLTPAQEAGLTYETEDEVRYLVNQTVRYFLSAGSAGSGSISAPSGSAGGPSATTSPTAGPLSSTSSTSNTTSHQINPEQAKRSIDTYFRLIQVVIFTRSQNTKESPNFPNYLEEVLVGNTKELITCNKQLFDRMNSVLLATPRGANCRHACASVYSVVVMATETPTQALQTAKNMLAAIPTPGSHQQQHIDGESSHAVQGMFMGAAYLLERLFTRYVAIQGAADASRQDHSTGTVAASSTTGSSGPTRKSKKEKHQQQQQQQGQQQQEQKQLRLDIIAAIEQMVTLMSTFLVKPSCLFHNVLATTTTKEKRSAHDSGFYVNSSIAQATVAAILEALMIVTRAGCLSHLPAGSLPIPGGATPNLVSSKAAMVHRIAVYLPSASTYGTGVGSGSGELAGAITGQQHVAQAALRALAACCMGEGTERVSESGGKGSGNPKESDTHVTSHPHTIAILKLITDTAEINDPSLHLAVGIAIADCLLGPASPLKRHWYERVYPLVVVPKAIEAAVASPAGVWLAKHLEGLLTHRPGQVQARPATLAAAFWTLALVRRIGPLPSALLSDRLIIDLLEEKDESVQCVAVATLGQIYDRSSEEVRAELVANLTRAIVGSGKRQGSPVYSELCNLAQQIGRPDLALSLIVLAIAPPPNTRALAGSSAATNVGCCLAASVTYAGLVRRLGRALAPALPRLVPRIFVRRFDHARPKLRQAMENVWIGLVSYASSLVAPSSSAAVSPSSSIGLSYSQAASSSSSPTVGPTAQQQQSSGVCSAGSLHSLSSEMIEAHFNAIICEIKTQLGFNTVSVTAGGTSGVSPGQQSSPDASTQATGPSNTSRAGITGTQSTCLRDACCLAIANLTHHPSADRRLAGHLPALLSGLLGLCDEYGTTGPSVSEHTSSGLTPPEEAAIAVQKLVIRVLENPCSREAAAGLLPGLLPVIIDRAPWSLTSVSEQDPVKGAGRASHLPSESRRLALELLLAAARTARPSALRPALPQLVLAGLHTMSSVHPSLVASLMRQPIHHLHQLHATTTSAGVSTGASAITVANSMASSLLPTCTTNNKEIQMAEVLRLCVRLIDDVCLSRLIVPFTELIRAGGGAGTVTVGASNSGGGGRLTGTREAASVATAACVFISHLAAANASAMAASAAFNRANVCCARCSVFGPGSANEPEHIGSESPSGSPHHPLHPSPCNSTHSSPPSSVLGPTPPTPPSCGPLDSTPVSVHESDGHPAPHRCCRGVGQKHGTSLLQTSPVRAAVPGTGTASSRNIVIGAGTPVSGGGGFASLVPHTGKLLAALLSALPGACRNWDSAGKAVQVEMARTLASLLRFAKETSVAKLFNRVRTWYLHPEPVTCTTGSSSLSVNHWACARVLHAVAHHCPDLLYAHAGITLPLIFLNRQPEPEGSNSVDTKVDYTLAHSLDANNSTATRDTDTTDDFEPLRPLWQETWEELLAKIPTTTASPCTGQLFWQSNPAAALKLFSSSSCSVVTSFLHSPLLDHCTQLIRDALLDCPSWTVHTQAALAVLHLAAQLIGQPVSNSTTNRARVEQQRPCPAGSENEPTGLSEDAASTAEGGTTEAFEQDEANTADGKVKGIGDDHEWTVHAWLSLVQLIAQGLTNSKPWPGKTCLLRAGRLLAVYARERGLASAPSHEAVVQQLWCALVRETRVKRAEAIGPGYRAEAFLSLASFAEASSKDALRMDDAGVAEQNSTDGESVDRLSSLFLLIVPQWSKRGKHGDHAKTLVLNTELSDSELELAVRAVGILWPMRRIDEHLKRFAETIQLLNFVLSHSSRRVQAASLASVLGIMAKLTPEQSSQLVASVEKTGKPLVELELKDLLVRIKQAAENPKSQLLREHALGCVATLLRHPAFLSLCRDQVTQILCSFSNDVVASLRDCSADLLKSL